jgi:putative mRNA 3-end processing factor
MLQNTDHGLYCPAGDFFIDPWRPVDRAVVTHAHSDHARYGCKRYLVSREGEHVFRTRLGEDAHLQTVEYGEIVHINGVRVSLHPAGHILGSAQIRVEYGGEVWVVSGDYKLQSDPTCTPFEPVKCHTFVTESTFGLPIYRWQPSEEVMSAVNAWWRANAAAGKASVLFGYALGKSQRLLAGLDSSSGPIYTHGGVERLNMAYRASGIPLPDTQYAITASRRDWSGAMIIAPPAALGTPWMRKFGSISTGFASGWMRIRGARRRRAVDRGFVLSDHVDWTGLLAAIEATGADMIWVTHGYTAVVVRYLSERGIRAQAVSTRFEGEPTADEIGDADLSTPDSTVESTDTAPDQ